MIYSRQMHGMADLNLINLDTRQLTLLWDGYISQSSYSYSLENCIGVLMVRCSISEAIRIP
jgi:hypothetical protein